MVADTGRLEWAERVRCGGTVEQGIEKLMPRKKDAAVRAAKLEPLIAGVMALCAANEHDTGGVPVRAVGVHRDVEVRERGAVAAWETDVRRGTVVEGVIDEACGVSVGGAAHVAHSGSSSVGVRGGESGDGNDGGGSHASPRPHPRCAHWRHLMASGEKWKVWVHSTEVCADPEGKIKAPITIHPVG